MLEIITFITLNIVSLFVVIILITIISWACFALVNKFESENYNKY